MADSLQQRTVQALSWSLVEAVAQRGAQFIIGIILARLLFPEQFGLIGMLMIFMAVIRAFLDSGFGAALIQKQEVTQTDICSIFYFNIVGAGGRGPPEPRCPGSPPLSAAGPDAPDAGAVVDHRDQLFGLIQNTILIKQINFKTQTKVSLISGVLSGIIGITLAARGFGVWSLAIQQISSSFVRTGCLWLFSSWRPTLIFSLDALREMFGFGSRLLFSSVLNQIFDNIYLVVIGRLFSAADLGFFTRAKTLNDLPSQSCRRSCRASPFPCSPPSRTIVRG
jgi:O-antigen/teichoic acid export membrane protein